MVMIIHFLQLLHFLCPFTAKVAAVMKAHFIRLYNIGV